MATIITEKFGLTLYPTPVFNTPDLPSCFGGKDGDSLPLDDKNLNRTVETVLLKDSKVQLLKQIGESHIWQIKTEEYPYPQDLYIDDRFIMHTLQPPEERTRILPSAATLIKKLKEIDLYPYMWGGNWPQGIDLLPKLYPSSTPFAKLEPLIQNSWKLSGVDCTGLPYYLTNGYTPRNSSCLVHFGNPVPIKELSVERIIDRLQALDFIVWNGHLVWVLDKQNTIESRYPCGIIKYPLFDRLSEIMKDRKPVDLYSSGEERQFVVRRWHPEYLNTGVTTPDLTPS